MPEMDMRRMQEEAARRAREMQSRARQGRPRPVSPSEPEPPAAEHNSPEPPAPPGPLPQPQAASPAAASPPMAEPPKSLLEELFRDRERTMLLALLLILGGEEGNTELMFALLFLLM